MLISIGILAWNEEDVIQQTLESLFEQSVFKKKIINDLPQFEWEIIVVPNGCSDATAKISESSLSGLIKDTEGLKIDYSVHEIKEPGKSNAWNRYIHEFLNKKSDLILMIDADIEFNESDTISNTIKALENNPKAVAAVDLPLKDAVKKSKKSFIEWISTTSSSVSSSNGPVAIAGSYYCARYATLKDIWLPNGLPVEDGFLRAMIITNCFRSKIDESKIIRVPNASHYFSTLTSITEIFKHEVRLVVGTAMNCYLTWDLLFFSTDPAGPGAGVVIKNKIEKDPMWYASVINNAVRNRGFWVLPKGMLFRRFSKVKGNHGLKLIKKSFVSIIGFILDLPVFIAANRRLKKGRGVGFW